MVTMPAVLPAAALIWVSSGAPRKFWTSYSRTSRTDFVRGEQIRPAIVAFVPSAGGSATPR